MRVRVRVGAGAGKGCLGVGVGFSCTVGLNALNDKPMGWLLAGLASSSLGSRLTMKYQPSTACNKNETGIGD